MDKNKTFKVAELKEISNFDGLYGDTSGKYSSEYIFLELIATRSQSFDWNIKPHIHSHLYQVFIVKKGTLKFQESTKETPLEGPCVMLIPPTLLHGLQYTPNVEGHILTVSDSIIADIFKTSDQMWRTLEQMQILTNFEEEASFESILRIIENIEYELFNENPERTLMLRANILRFFVCIYRSSKLDEAFGANNLIKNYFRAFQQNIKQAVYPKSIPEFAEELHITPVHLNRICKKISGKSAIELVHQNIIIEAQKYLLHTSYSVSEIAYLLKFEYPNYFAKLFKKHVGLSPVEYRKQDRK